MARKKKEAVNGLPDLDKYLEGRRRHYVTYIEGARLYQLSYQTFVKLAKDANAIYKIKRRVLVNIQMVYDFMEAFH